MERGRPPIYSTAKELQDEVDSYLQDCVDKGKHPLITGLALALGFESRQSFYDYEKNPDFSYTIKRARMHIESSYEDCLRSNNCTGSIFALKNMGWKDKTEIEQSGSLAINWNESKTYENK
jgi:hypothetical protein